MPKVSVVMPVYNTKEEYLREAIESILNQTFTNFEFIIINDGSTNNAEDVILSYKDKRIRYFKQENCGISATRNLGFSLVEGEYIAVFDADDISLPQRIEKQVEFMDKNPNIGVCGSWYEIFPTNKIIKLKEYPKYFDTIGGSPFGHPVSMLRTENFKQNKLFYNENLKVSVDYDLWSRAIKYMDFYNLQEILLKYRWHENNVSVTKHQMQLENTYKIRKQMLDFLTDDEEIQKKFKEIIFGKTKEKINFFEKFFSIKNVYKQDKKYKEIRILGIKIKLGIKNEI